MLKRRHEGPRKKAAKEELLVLITHCTIHPPAGVELVASLREHVLVATPVRLYLVGEHIGLYGLDKS